VFITSKDEELLVSKTEADLKQNRGSKGLVTVMAYMATSSDQVRTLSVFFFVPLDFCTCLLTARYRVYSPAAP
jgi:hypothetical protein